MIPPILEIYVVWHPEDPDGGRIAAELIDHFHGTTYSGLVGGAVEVYVRSEGWRDVQGAPRPMPFMEPLPNGLPAPAITAVIPVLGSRLARAVTDKTEWREYVGAIIQNAATNELVGVFPARVDNAATEATELGDLFAAHQYLDPQQATENHERDAANRCRDLAQCIAEMIGDPLGDRLHVFISHTKRYSPDEEPDLVDDLVEQVRYCINDTHLNEFFDESDIQPGTDGAKKMVAEASSSALLVVRTDLYTSREWCQREFLTAKRSGMPVVTLNAVRGGEERGSFLMDHVPSIPVRSDDVDEQRAAIERTLNQLVDEALKRALWNQQAEHLASLGFDWLPSHAPEPITLAPWLKDRQDKRTGDEQIFVLHPDPPLGPDELGVLEELFSVAGLPGIVTVMTPRTFASRGGQEQP